MRMKISQYAKLNGLTYKTIWNYVKNGKIPFVRTPSGTILIEVEESENMLKNKSL